MKPADITKRRFPLAPLDRLSLDVPDEVVGLNWYEYASRTKPTFDPPGKVVATEYKGVFVLWAEHPFSVALITEQNLYPGTGAMARFIVDLAALDGHPENIELRNRRGGVMVIGRDMSGGGLFRSTWFDEDGPGGHSERNFLEQAVSEAVSDGYTEYAPGALDILAQSWRP